MTLPQFDLTNPPRVVVIGDIMLDHYLWGECTRVSPEAPVQVVHVERETHALGGAANVAANLASLGARPTVVGVVGRDTEREKLLDSMKQSGIDTSSILTSDVRPTTVKSRVIAGSQQIVRIDHEAAEDISTVLEEHVLAEAVRTIEGASVVILSDYAKGVLTPRVCEGIIKICRERGVPVIVDPKGCDYGKYRGATLVTPNRKEASLAVGRPVASREDALHAGRELREMLALTACLVTLSEDGMALVEAEREMHLPTEAREVFDVTGAGDTVVAALALSLAAGYELIEACKFANTAAGLVVGKVGSATVTFEELRRAAAPTLFKLASKIMARGALSERVAQLRKKGQRIVFTNGCFDVLHAGHVRYLTQAAAMGDVLIVALNDDASVARLKGPSRPVNQLGDRAMIMAALAPVSFVTNFHEDTPMNLIELLEPDVLVKGGDYVAEDIVGAAFLRARGKRVEILPFLAGRSTTRTLAHLNTPPSSVGAAE